MSKKILRQIESLSSDLNTKKSDSSQVWKKTVSVTNTIVHEKQKPIADGESVNVPDQSVNGNEHDEDNVYPDKATVTPDVDTVNPPEQIVHENEHDTVSCDEENVDWDKETVTPDVDTFNPLEQIVHENEHYTANHDENNVDPDKPSVNADNDNVNGHEETVHGNTDTLTVDNYNVNADEQMFNPDHVRVIMPVTKTELDTEDVKPNVEECVVHGNSAATDQSAELFSEDAIKKEEIEDDPALNDSSISVKGRLSDEVTGSSFEELVTAADNGKQEDVDVDVSLYTESAQTLQADDKNTQYSGNTY